MSSTQQTGPLICGDERGTFRRRRWCQNALCTGAPVAQLDRALPSEGRGRTFESCRVRHISHWGFRSINLSRKLRAAQSGHRLPKGPTDCGSHWPISAKDESDWMSLLNINTHTTSSASPKRGNIGVNPSDFLPETLLAMVTSRCGFPLAVKTPSSFALCRYPVPSFQWTISQWLFS